MVGTKVAPLRAFVAYTAQDLAVHADKVLAVLRSLEVVAIDFRSVSGEGRPSVDWCTGQIDDCDMVIVLVAHRYGWVPSPGVGGDGQRSITEIEARHGRARDKVVLPFIIDDNATWPVSQIEALGNPSAGDRLNAFKDYLRDGWSVGFFTDANSLDGPVSRAVAGIKTRMAAAAAVPPSQESTVRGIDDRRKPPEMVDRMEEPALPKRVLCIDDSASMAVTFAYLNRLEELLQIRYAEPEFKLCDYFDLIAGSGLGALAAADLAIGSSVAEVEDWFTHTLFKVLRNHGSMISFLVKGYTHDAKRLAAMLEAKFKEKQFHRAQYKTGVALVAARLDLGIPVHFSNHPKDASTYGDLTLSRALLGCSADIPDFPPVRIDLGREGSTILSAADIVGATNPTLHVLQMITSPPFHWAMGANRLAMFSIGGLARHDRLDPVEISRAWVVGQILMILRSLIRGASFTTSLMMNALALGRSSSLTYHRFELASSDKGLVPAELADLLEEADSLSNDELLDQAAELRRLGRIAAEKQIDEDVFAPAFDVRRRTSMGSA